MEWEPIALHFSDLLHHFIHFIFPQLNSHHHCGLYPHVYFLSKLYHRITDYYIILLTQLKILSQVNLSHMRIIGQLLPCTCLKDRPFE